MTRRSLPVISTEPAAESAAPRRTRSGRHKVLLVYPRPGFSGVFVNHVPLSLLYAAVELVKHGVEVEIFDLRLHPDNWRAELRARVSRETLAVGLNVMTGRPILDAIDVGRFVKTLDPAVRVVWGGPHVTFAPETVFDEPSVDHAIAGYGSKPLDQLISALLADEAPADIPGLSTRRGARGRALARGEVLRAHRLAGDSLPPDSRPGGLRAVRHGPRGRADVQRPGVPVPVHVL